MTPLRYSVLGAGAMGSVFGARLRLAGFEVELLNRSPAHSEAIRANGLQATLDGTRHTLDIAATTVDQARPADVVIAFTKSHQLQAALQALPDTLQQAQVLVLQNGLGNGERAAQLLGAERVIEGVSMMPAEFISPGVIASSDAAQTWMYPLSGELSAQARQIGEDFNQAGIITHVIPEVRQFIWQKACFNIAMNALCGLTQGSPGLLQQFPDGRALAHELADEALQVARLSGVELDDNKVHELIDYACAQHRFHKPSMLQDLEQGRRTEIEALNGYLVARADELGVAVPLNRVLLRLLRLRERAPEFWEQEPA
ncbi:MAG: 2-dehydropantoate 2-reductase [Thiolinea sp.]